MSWLPALNSFSDIRIQVWVETQALILNVSSRLSHPSIAVKRHCGLGNYYERKRSLGACLQFQSFHPLSPCRPALEQ